jgi:hypothetical protein
MAGHLYISIPPFVEASFGANSLLRWDTSALPADAMILGASLKAVVVIFRDNDAASLTADWCDWGETCDVSFSRMKLKRPKQRTTPGAATYQLPELPQAMVWPPFSGLMASTVRRRKTNSPNGAARHQPGAAWVGVLQPPQARLSGTVQPGFS